MLDPQTLLDIKYFNGADYTNLKMKLGSPDRDTFSVTLLTTDSLYIGYEKPIKNFYIDISSPNTSPNTLSLEYYNGSAWVAIPDIYDETEGFTRSGLIQWGELLDMSSVEIDSSTKYWVRITPSVDHTLASWNFLGLILASDRDLLLENPYILETNLLMGETNHLKAHIAARNEIVQTYCNRGYDKVTASNHLKKITFWDILDIQEFRQGAVFLALSKIYFNLSDRSEDTWLKKSQEYRKRYSEQIDLYYVTLDKNDNGIINSSERGEVARTRTISR